MPPSPPRAAAVPAPSPCWRAASSCSLRPSSPRVRALGQEPTVTLLANWTGTDERNFRATVLDPFARTHHIHVDYQGSSAESQVLGADVEAEHPARRGGADRARRTRRPTPGRDS
ncbi:hypothetical protein ACQ4WX_37315 [Streptomyces lasalocidi]